MHTVADAISLRLLSINSSMHDYRGLIVGRLGFHSQYCRNEMVMEAEDVT